MPDINSRHLLALSSGIFAGFGTTLTLIAVPAIEASSDPLPAWQEMYKKGSKMAISLILLSSGAGLKGYLESGGEDWRFLLCSGTSLIVIPYTVLFMRQTNKELLSMKPEQGKSLDPGVRMLVTKWKKLQYVRTALGLTAFFINVWIMHKKW